MEIKPDTSRVLMSDVLKGTIPELEDEIAKDPISGKHVIAIAHRVVAGKADGLVGILRGVLFGKDPEIAFRIELNDAMDIVDAPQLHFNGFEFHHGERIIKMPGPFLVEAARIDDISAQDQMCTLSLHLKRPAR
jgi:hypothetical protein